MRTGFIDTLIIGDSQAGLAGGATSRRPFRRRSQSSRRMTRSPAMSALGH